MVRKIYLKKIFGIGSFSVILCSIFNCFIFFSGCEYLGSGKQGGQAKNKGLEDSPLSSYGIPKFYLLGNRDSTAFQFQFIEKKSMYTLVLSNSKDSIYYTLYHFESPEKWVSLFNYRFKDLAVLIKTDTLRINDTCYLSMIYKTSLRLSDNKLYFSIINPLSKKIYTLRYHYQKDYTNLSSNYQMDFSMKPFKEQIQELDRMANRFENSKDSAFTAGITPEVSLVKRWVMLNDRVYDELGSAGKTFQLNIEDVKGDIGPSILDFENSDSLFKQNVTISETNQYKFASLIKGPVYCFSKSQNKSFIVWVPDSPNHYIHTIRIVGNSIQLFDTTLVNNNHKLKLKPKYIFNLSQKTIKRMR